MSPPSDEPTSKLNHLLDRLHHGTGHIGALPACKDWDCVTLRDLIAQVEVPEPLAYRCEAHQGDAAGCPCCDAVRIADLEAENERLRIKIANERFYRSGMDD